MRRALLDFTSILMILVPAIVAILSLYFAFQQLGQISREIGRLAAERVIVAKGNCTISIVRQA